MGIETENVEVGKDAVRYSSRCPGDHYYIRAGMAGTEVWDNYNYTAGWEEPRICGCSYWREDNCLQGYSASLSSRN